MNREQLPKLKWEIPFSIILIALIVYDFGYFLVRGMVTNGAKFSIFYTKNFICGFHMGGK